MSEEDGDRPASPGGRGQSPSVLDDLVIARFNDVPMVERLLGEAVERDLAALLVDPVMSNAVSRRPSRSSCPRCATCVTATVLSSSSTR
ncbi:hypothetical protein [Amycolatopsis camponoti]|uniref:hypothetical protein n=1 Tax=Amycolatopsis camponoti TaxID=2606593 RepID=UPI001E56E03F|nr:hypothetical protein [Amycolatopsis camponoti]